MDRTTLYTKDRERLAFDTKLLFLRILDNIGEYIYLTSPVYLEYNNYIVYEMILFCGTRGHHYIIVCINYVLVRKNARLKLIFKDARF